MDAETLTALKGSIDKWRAIVDGTGTNEGPGNCPLCKMFWNDRSMKKPPCVGCPVRERTGAQYCRGTPYEEYEDAENAGDHNAKELREMAQTELDFLISLLPVEE